MKKTSSLIWELVLFFRREPKQIVNRGLVEFSQSNQVMGGDFLNSFFVFVILLLCCVKQFADGLLR